VKDALMSAPAAEIMTALLNLVNRRTTVALPSSDRASERTGKNKISGKDSPIKEEMSE
jgi:hypothetical protein